MTGSNSAPTVSTTATDWSSFINYANQLLRIVQSVWKNTSSITHFLSHSIFIFKFDNSYHSLPDSCSGSHVFITHLRTQSVSFFKISQLSSFWMWSHGNISWENLNVDRTHPLKPNSPPNKMHIPTVASHTIIVCKHSLYLFCKGKSVCLLFWVSFVHLTKGHRWEKMFFFLLEKAGMDSMI